jgi:TetR/AcrR family transcriptional regulator, copper-responsive repressor
VSIGSRNILNRSVCYTIVTIVGRPKKFNRQSVLEKALPVFWKCGFADASLHDLELATGVNKSGLYSEFKDKEDLFIQSLQYYLDNLELARLLAIQPFGWDNIERFLKVRPRNRAGLKGCFAVNSMREFAILPRQAVDLVTQSRMTLRGLIAKNIESQVPETKVNVVAEMVQTFFTGLCMEQNVSSSRAAVVRKVDEFMKIIRQLRG